MSDLITRAKAYLEHPPVNFPEGASLIREFVAASGGCGCSDADPDRCSRQKYGEPVEQRDGACACPCHSKGKTLEELLEAALRRVVAANAGLGKIEDGVTLYERQPSKSDASLAAWLELNDAVGQAKVALQAAKIARDPDTDETNR